MCHCIITYFNVVTGLSCYYRPWQGAPGHGRKLLYGLNSIYKSFMFQLISTVQLPGENIYDTQVVMHTGTHTYDVSFSREFQKHLSSEAHKHGVIGQGKYKKCASKLEWT